MKARIKRKIQKRPYLYNVGQVFKACDWLTSIQRGNIVWHRYHSFGTITYYLYRNESDTDAICDSIKLKEVKF